MDLGYQMWDLESAIKVYAIGQTKENILWHFYDINVILWIF